MKKSILVALFYLFLTEGFSQEALTFDDCLNLAMANNLALKSAGISENVALVQRRASYGQFLPSITADGENRNSWGKEIDPDTNTFTNDDLRNTEGTLNANFNLFSGFLVHNSVKLARQQLELNRADVDRIRNEVTIELATRFITILYLQEIIAANEMQIAASASQLGIVELKFNSGAIAESEVFKIKSQKASEELALLTNQNNLADNLIGLKQLINIPIEQEVLLLKPDLELSEQIVEEEDQFARTKKAVDIHPAFKMSLIEQQKARTELALARTGIYPTLGLRLMYRSNYDSTIRDIVDFKTQVDENTSKQIRFYLTIPIFSKFANSSKIKSSKLIYNQSKVVTELERNRISKEVLKAITDAKTSLKKKESSAIAFEFSQKSYDADLLKFEMGKIDISDLNMTKILYNRAQADLIQSKYELLFNNALIKFYSGEVFSL